MSALIIDADGSGYLATSELLEVQRLRNDFASACQSIALRLLKDYDEPNAASTYLANEISKLRSSISHVSFEQNDAILFSFLDDHIGQALEREGRKSELARNLSRFMLLIPDAFRWIALAGGTSVLVWAIINQIHHR